MQMHIPREGVCSGCIIPSVLCLAINLSFSSGTRTLRTDLRKWRQLWNVIARAFHSFTEIPMFQVLWHSS